VSVTTVPSSNPDWQLADEARQSMGGIVGDFTWPEPVTLMFNRCERLKVAVTLRLADITSEQVIVPVQSPVNPAKREPDDAVLRRSTGTGWPCRGKLSEQSVGQEIPGESEVTLPVPVPASVTWRATVAPAPPAPLVPEPPIPEPPVPKPPAPP
jgi:hypothetical protein